MTYAHSFAQQDLIAPDRYRLLADLAEAYYVQGLTQAQIAERFGVARPTVSRLLADARQLGVVEIQVHRLFEVDEPLSREIKQSFGVEAAVVRLPRLGGPEARRELGQLAAALLHDALRPGAILGVTMGATVQAVVERLTQLRPLPITVVQLCGSSGAADPDLDCHATVQRLAQAYACDAAYFHAPFIVESAEIRESLRNNDGNRRCIALGRRADVSLVGIGGSDPETSSLVQGGHVPASDLCLLRRQGVVGDVGGFSLLATGDVVEPATRCWMTALAWRDYLRIPLRFGAALGADKAEACAAALRGRLVNRFVTDSVTAEAILRLETAP